MQLQLFSIFMSVKSARIFTVSPWEKLENFISDSQYSSIFLLCDKNTFRECLPYFKSQMPKLECEITIIPAGEQIKDLETCQDIWSQWLKSGIERNSLILCLGGGVVSDIGGFCAATIIRGVDCIYIPTSLMAMADASIGGKTGINFHMFKNQVGTFTMPKAIVIDAVFLKTLSERHLRNGYVEMIKHSLIQSPPYFQDLTTLTWPLNESDLLEYMKKSIRTKTDIIEQDFSEKSIRKSLNFGHTIGHALEGFFLEQGLDVLHGEAVAAGIICESFISSELFKWRPNTLDSIRNFLKPFAGDLRYSDTDYPAIMAKMHLDKKRKNKNICFSLLDAPGKPVFDQMVRDELIYQSLEYFNQV